MQEGAAEQGTLYYTESRTDGPVAQAPCNEGHKQPERRQDLKKSTSLVFLLRGE